MARAKREGVQDYHLRQVDQQLAQRVKRQAEREGVSMRDVAIAGFKAFAAGKLRVTPQE